MAGRSWDKLPGDLPGGTAMHIGVLIFATDYTIRTDELGEALEERGFESLLLPEHTHIPASRKSPWPGGGDLPKEYWHTHDPFVALSFAARATTTLKLGTGICLLPQRDPIVTAKSVASLDMLIDAGGKPANFMDIRPEASSRQIAEGKGLPETGLRIREREIRRAATSGNLPARDSRPTSR